MSDIDQAPAAEAAPEAPDSSGTPETTAPQGPDLSGLQDFFEQRFGGLEQRLESALAPPEPEPEVADPYAGLGELGYSDEETSATREVLQGILSQEIQGAVGPLQQEIQRLRSELDYGDLEERYPQLATEEGAEKVMAESRQAAVDIGRQLGLAPEQAQQLAMSPKLMELAHLAQMGRERATQEQPARPGAELEQPGGASPPEPEVDVNEQILGAAQPGNFWQW